MLTLITPASAPVIDITQFQAHLHGVGECDDSGDLAGKLDSACEYISESQEGCNGRALLTSTWDLALERFPCSGYIEIPLGNLQSVAWVKYRIPRGTVKTLDSSRYRAERVYVPQDLSADPPVVGSTTSDCGIGRIYTGYGIPWPSEALDVGEPVTVRFTCGWDIPEHVPFSIRSAILLVAATLYRNRESVFVGRSEVAALLKVAGELDAVKSLCGRYRDGRF